MSLKIAVLKETAEFEKRVAASPETVKKLSAAGCAVHIETGAGEGAAMPDALFSDAGAVIEKTGAAAAKDADILLCVQPPSDAIISALKKGALLIGILNPYKNSALIEKCAQGQLTALSMELMPRITRAQAMDVLSSQANLAGYKAVLEATAVFGRAFPMMMTAAGTVPPARVFVMGAGVAGLQAIATAKRLGAIVSATDVRPAAREQVESLGGQFVAVEDDEFREAESAGGYAKEMSDAYKQKQQALIEETIAKQDVVITTALIPGRPAPVLVTEKMVKSMKPGAIIVDLAVEQGGNCALSEPGKTIEKHGVTIIGHYNIPSRLAASTAQLYAKNLLNLVNLLIDQDAGALALNWDDEIIKGIALTHQGQIIHPNFSGASAEKTPAKETPAKEKSAPAKAPANKQAAKKTDDKA